MQDLSRTRRTENLTSEHDYVSERLMPGPVSPCLSVPALPVMKRTESYLRQLLTAHIYFKMNEENQSVRANKNPVCCLCPCAIVIFRHSLTPSEGAGWKQITLKILYPAHAELLVAKVAGRKISRDRDVLFTCHHPSILQEGKPGVANCWEQRTRKSTVSSHPSEGKPLQPEQRPLPSVKVSDGEALKKPLLRVSLGSGHQPFTSATYICNPGTAASCHPETHRSNPLARGWMIKNQNIIKTSMCKW